MPPTPEVNEELLRQSQIEATCNMLNIYKSIQILCLIFLFSYCSYKIKNAVTTIGHESKNIGETFHAINKRNQDYNNCHHNQ